MDIKQDVIVKVNAEKLLTEYKSEVEIELDEILAYWMHHTKDALHGGFIGRIDEDNIAYPDAEKGAVLNCRILWAFSAAYKITLNADHLLLANISFNYIASHFVDKINGGIYWTVDAAGKPLNTKKQIYALAFAIYGCSAYYVASKNEEAKTLAIELFETIEKYSFDSERTGYAEAFTIDWKPIEDLRLSVKDANEKKTMNTHLHVLEAYTTLYKIWPDVKLKDQIYNLIRNFTKYIIDPATGHLNLFFDDNWNSRSQIISYGHDIEAAWLLLEACEVLKDELLLNEVRECAMKISLAAAEGLDTDGGLWYENDLATKHFIKEKHNWVQAEAMVGFFNFWQITGAEIYLQKSVATWNYIKNKIKDKTYGEWFWGRNEDGTIMKGQDKVGLWKCPYHNTRACIEIISRIKSIKLSDVLLGNV